MGDPALCIPRPFFGPILLIQLIMLHQIFEEHSDHHIRHVLAHALSWAETEAPVVIPELRRLVLQETLWVVGFPVCAPTAATYQS